MRNLGALTLAALLAVSAPPAQAALPQGALDRVSADGRPGAQLPEFVRFTDESGVPLTFREAHGSHPAVLIFADYTCRTLCGPILEFAAAGLEKSGLNPGSDYRLVVVGLDPKDGLAEVHAMRRSHVPPESPLAAATTMLIGSASAVHAITEAAGYHYAYDPEHDQFAHPAAAYVITAEGKIARVLSGLGLNGNDLRLALVDAGEGRVGTIVDHLRLLCYGFDPALGIYTSSIERWLAISALCTVLAMSVWIGLMIRTTRRRVS
jgi:protein SCO1